MEKPRLGLTTSNVSCSRYDRLKVYVLTGFSELERALCQTVASMTMSDDENGYNKVRKMTNYRKERQKELGRAQEKWMLILSMLNIQTSIKLLSPTFPHLDLNFNLRITSSNVYVPSLHHQTHHWY